MKRIATTLAAVLLTLLVPATATQAAGFTIIPQSESVTATGQSYGGWASSWWTNILAVPSPGNPADDATGANCLNGQPQGSPVFFLAGSFVSDSVTRSCTVPSGKYLFMPFINILDIHIAGSDQQDTAQKLRENLLSWGYVPATELHATLDGVDIPSPTITSQPGTGYLACAGGNPHCGPVVTIGAGGYFGIPLPLNVGEGYWLMLAPLSAGSHTLTFGGIWTGLSTSRTLPGRATTQPPQGSGGPPTPATPVTRSQAITYHLTVS